MYRSAGSWDTKKICVDMNIFCGCESQTPCVHWSSADEDRVERHAVRMGQQPARWKEFGSRVTREAEDGMLVLSRKPNESVQIDSTIQVVVVSIGKGRVKLGFNAPGDIRILRSELKARESDAVEEHHDLAVPQVK
jgi:carbon storage regulator